MTFEEFDKLVKKMIEEERAVCSSKGKEYSQYSRLDNFEKLGRDLDLDPKKVLWVYLSKHLTSIANYIREGKVYSESIESRIMDTRVYLSLLRGLIEDEKKEENKKENVPMMTPGEIRDAEMQRRAHGVS